MKRLVAIIAVSAFALSMAANYTVAQTDKAAEKPKAECKCGKDCSGENCKCGCHTAKKDEKTDKAPEKKQGA